MSTTPAPDQRSLTEQLRDLHAMAVKAGMYDAADWLTSHRLWAPPPPFNRMEEP